MGFVVPQTEDTEMAVLYEAGDIVVINPRYFASASNASIIMAFLPNRVVDDPSSNVVDPILILQQDQESCFKFSKPSTTTAEKTTKDSIIRKLDKSEYTSMNEEDCDHFHLNEDDYNILLDQCQLVRPEEESDEDENETDNVDRVVPQRIVSENYVLPTSRTRSGRTIGWRHDRLGW